MRGKRSATTWAETSGADAGQGKRNKDDALSYALANRTRVEIRAILNDGDRSRKELARLTGEHASRIGWHVLELQADGLIGHQAKRVGSAVKHYYRAIGVPSYSEEEVAAMTPEARKALIGIALHSSFAEALAAFWAGKMVPDPNAVLAWRWFNVDARGHEAIATEQARSWARMQETAAESAGRCVEPGIPLVVSSLRYVRSRFSPFPPAILLDPIEGAREVAHRLSRGERSVEEALSYAIKDKLRIEILTILNEGDRTRYELAALIGVEPDKIKHHLKELLDEGSIELACSTPVGNMMQNYYRAIRMPSYSAEEFAALSPESRQAIVGVTLQGLVAEALAAFRAGTMIDDRRRRIAWSRLPVDAQGREDICEEQVRSWERMYEIEAEAMNRVAESGEPTKSIIVNSLGFVCSRRAGLGGTAIDPTESIVGGIDLGSETHSAQVG
jgi:DNA-binding transcriptional ArsR family regulator